MPARMTTCSPERHGPYPTEIRMLETESASLPVNNQIGARCVDIEWILLAGPRDLLNNIFTAEGVTAIPQYLDNLVAAGLVFFERDHSFSLPPVKVDPYSAVIE